VGRGIKHQLLRVLLAGALLGLTVPGFGEAREVEFNRDIRPLLSNNCFTCHGPDEAERKADLRLDTEEGATRDLGGYAAVVPGKPDQSELVLRVTDDDPDYRMPPPESNLSLSASEKKLLERWIRQGAEWEEHWAFVPPEKRPLPSVKRSDWPRNAIDFFVLARLEEEGIAPSPQADPRTLLRRVTLDLTGLPPEPEEIEAYLRQVKTEGLDAAYEAAVTRLLHSLRYAERMTWQWLEAARYADTDGYQNDGPRDMWRWRDWVIEAYRKGMTFDRFTIEQLAGDLLPNPDLDQLIATGFNRNHRYNSESGLVLEEFLLENAVDRVDTTSTVWMGLTMGCARCHDHKYDPFSQKEYYQLIAYFNRVPESGRAIKFGNSEPWIQAPTEQQRRQLSRLKENLREAEARLREAEPRVAEALRDWEASKRDSETAARRFVLEEGLDHHFGAGADWIERSGENPEPLGKVSGLVGNNRFSVAFRLRPEQVERGAVLSTEAGDTRRRGLLLEFHEGRLRFFLISRWIAGVTGLETERELKPGDEVHVALTNDGTQRAQGVTVYLDGKPAATRVLHNTYSNRGKPDAEEMLRAGGSKHVGNWSGQIADLRIFSSTTLLAEEVQWLAVRSGIEEIRRKPAQSRSPEEAAKLQAWFLEHAAPEPLAGLADEVRLARDRLVRFTDGLPTTMVMEDRPERGVTRVRERGVYHKKGARVEAGVPDVFPALPPGAPDNRLGFARWLVSGEHPLTARVTVNRYWQLLFGRGLVKTAEDFGAQGSLPSHPDLLDWLAVEFVEQGWDVRQLLRKIVLSATYRQSSALRPELQVSDPENRLLARAPRLRLTGNELRDQALAVSGLLVEKPGGPSVKPYQPPRLWKEASNFTYRQDKGEKLYRRSLYTYWKRTLAPPSMAVLDTADREWCSVLPKSTNTPLQALTLLNETGFFEAARKLGERMVKEHDSREERIRSGFVRVTAREPEEAEMTLLKRAWREYENEFSGDPAAARKLLTVGESPVEVEDSVLAATAASVANVLLNLEEATTRE